MRFFEPTPEFAAWVVEYAQGRPIIELGCGDGYFTYLLRQAGAKAMGIDPFKDGEYLDYTCFMQRAASEFSVVANTPCLLIAARPDHSGWVTNVPFQMHNDSELMYIGLTRNIETDLGGLDFVSVDTVLNEIPDLGEHVVLSLFKHEGDPPNVDLGSLRKTLDFWA